MKISNNLSNVSGSVTAQIFAETKRLQRLGQKILNLSIGQPKYPPINPVLESISSAVLEGKVQYSESKGIIELREAINNYYGRNNDPEKEIIVTAGGKIGIFASLWAVCNPGDNVVILNPSWVSYKDIVGSLGCEPRFIQVDDDFRFDEERLRKVIDGKTKAIVVNSPCNPTGAIISEKNLSDLYRICLEFDLLLISDEIYNEYTYDSNKFTSLTSIKNWKENGVIINGFSKTFSMTGLRLGYTLTNEKISKEINKVMQLTASCAPLPSQIGGVKALETIDETRAYFKPIVKKNRELMIKLSKEIDGLVLFPPHGAIYGWYRIEGESDSAAWASNLLSNERVAVTPGIGFGPAGEGFFRICFAVDQETLEDGITQIGKFVMR